MKSLDFQVKFLLFPNLRKKKENRWSTGVSQPPSLSHKQLKLNDGREKAVMCLSQEAQAYYH